MTLYVNHLGFPPASAKYCLLGGPLETGFTTKELASGKTAFQGHLRLTPGDIGMYPPTPFLPGAVMNGISGDAADAPQLRPGIIRSANTGRLWFVLLCG